MARETAFVLLRCIILAADESWKTKAFNFLSQPSNLHEELRITKQNISAVFVGATLALLYLCFFEEFLHLFVVTVSLWVLFLETTLDFFFFLYRYLYLQAVIQSTRSNCKVAPA